MTDRGVAERAGAAALAAADAAAFAVRRRRLLLAGRAAALRAAAPVTVEIDATARIGPGVRITAAPGRGGTLRIGPGCALEGVALHLAGGTVDLGHHVTVRTGTAIMAAGDLLVDGPALLSWGTVIHCDERIRLEPQVVIAERGTVTDSVHHHSEPGVWLLDNVRTRPVTIGTNTWLGAGVTVARASVGDHCIVAANSLVVDDVPSGAMARGVPAEVIRPARLPWLDS